MRNKYPGYCNSCGNRVAAHAGEAFKLNGNWTVQHLDCGESHNQPLTFKQKYGRCEDAPCCGCCGGDSGDDVMTSREYFDGGYGDY